MKKLLVLCCSVLCALEARTVKNLVAGTTQANTTNDQLLTVSHDAAHKSTHEQIQAIDLSSAHLIDETIAIVHGPERKFVICRSDLSRVNIGGGGRPQSLDDIIFQELVYQDALRYKVPIDESVIDKYILNIQKEFKLSLNEVKEIFHQSGYTYQEGRDQLRKMYAVQSLLDHKIKSRLFVPQADIEAFFHDHPTYKPAKFKLQLAFVPVTKGEDKAAVKKRLGNSATIDTQVAWGPAFWLQEDDVASESQFIKKMQKGDISQPQEVQGGFEVFKLVERKEKRVIPLEKRAREIADTLRRPKYEELLTSYRRGLHENASIVYFDASYKPAQAVVTA